MNNEERLKRLVEHLTPHCSKVRPAVLRFTGKAGVQEISGCYYEQTIVSTNSRNEPVSVFRRGFNLLAVPLCYEKRRRVEPKLIGSPTVIVNNDVCFNLCGDAPATLRDHEWFVSGYYLGPPTDMQPIGENCLLGEWDVPDGTKIDELLGPGGKPYVFQKPYRRLMVEVKFLGEPDDDA